MTEILKGEGIRIDRKATGTIGDITLEAAVTALEKGVPVSFDFHHQDHTITPERAADMISVEELEERLQKLDDLFIGKMNSVVMQYREEKELLTGYKRRLSQKS